MDTRRPTLKRGIVLLYALCVFATITAIGLNILDSGDLFQAGATSDYFLMNANNAALSGVAYGEALVDRVLREARYRRYVGTPPAVNMPGWCGARPRQQKPNAYAPLQGSNTIGRVMNNATLVWSITAGSVGWNPAGAATAYLDPNPIAYNYAWISESLGGGGLKATCRFLIELRQCSVPVTTPNLRPACVDQFSSRDFLTDQNFMRNDVFFPNNSPYVPRQHANWTNATGGTGGQIPSARDDVYTMRVEGLSYPGDARGAPGPRPTSRIICKELFNIVNNTGTPPRLNPQQFYYTDFSNGY